MNSSSSSSVPHFDFSDPESIFGNDAADFETDDEVFQSYAYERPELRLFMDESKPFRIVKAYKGEGKSALLRMMKWKLHERYLDPAPLIIETLASDISPTLEKLEWETCVRAWKVSIMNQVACELGSRIGVAWSDDSMSLVEEARKGGFRTRGFVGGVLARMPKIRAKGPNGEELDISLPIPLGSASSEQSVRRYLKSNSTVWVLIDDIDRAFSGDQFSKVCASSFFVACMELTRVIPQLRIRTSVRPNVWSALEPEFEHLSHVRQNIVTVSWTEDDVRTMLARRVSGYLHRTGQSSSLPQAIRPDTATYENACVALVFEPEMRWGRNVRSPHTILYTLSKHRPRWVVELCKVACRFAHASRRSRISLADVICDYREFGNRRIADTVAEFRSQCDKIGEIIDSFRRLPEEMSTDELLSHLNKKVLPRLAVRIAGSPVGASARDVAAFLFEVGLYYGRRDFGDESYAHIRHSDMPSLLKSPMNVDGGLRWEIHPVYRQALEMRDCDGHRITDARLLGALQEGLLEAMLNPLSPADTDQNASRPGTIRRRRPS